MAHSRPPDPAGALREALATESLEEREAAIYDLATELWKCGLLNEALGALRYIEDGYLADRIDLGAKIAADLVAIGSTDGAVATLRELEPLVSHCRRDAIPWAILDLVNAHLRIHNSEHAVRLLERLEEELSVPVDPRSVQLWVDTEKCKAEGALTWARIGNRDRAELLAASILSDHYRARALDQLHSATVRTQNTPEGQ